MNSMNSISSGHYDVIFLKISIFAARCGHGWSSFRKIVILTSKMINVIFLNSAWKMLSNDVRPWILEANGHDFWRRTASNKIANGLKEFADSLGLNEQVTIYLTNDHWLAVRSIRPPCIGINWTKMVQKPIGRFFPDP